MRSPILFLVFNRPDVTQRVFDAIRLARPSKLYIASDGPRANRSGEAQLCQEVQKIVSKIDWPCEVKRLIRDENLGCKMAVSGAIDWFFSIEPEGIILEDDCLPHPDFFNYCDELLEKYRNDERVGLISGTSLVDMDENKILWDREDFIFCKYFSVWGWASWRRVWKNYDVSISSWGKKKDAITALTRNKKLRLVHKKSFDAITSGDLNTWDYQLGFAIWTTSRVAVTPRFNLIENIGFGENATHTVRNGGELELSSKMSNKHLRFPLLPPELMCENMAYSAYLEKLSTKPFIVKLYNYVCRLVKNFRM